MSRPYSAFWFSGALGGFFAISSSLLHTSVSLAAPTSEEPEQALARLDADAAHKTQIAAPLEKARSALTRAKAMDHSGDQAHAASMRAVAREWLAVAEDSLRALDAESKALQKDKALDDLETKIVRGRALLEETVARRARAEALLEEVQRAEPAPPTSPAASKGKAVTVPAPGAKPTTEPATTPGTAPGLPQKPVGPGAIPGTPSKPTPTPVPAGGTK